MERRFRLKEFRWVKYLVFALFSLLTVGVTVAAAKFVLDNYSGNVKLIISLFSLSLLFFIALIRELTKIAFNRRGRRELSIEDESIKLISRERDGEKVLSQIDYGELSGIIISKNFRGRAALVELFYKEFSRVKQLSGYLEMEEIIMTLKELLRERVTIIERDWRYNFKFYLTGFSFKAILLIALFLLVLNERAGGLYYLALFVIFIVPDLIIERVKRQMVKREFGSAGESE